ncbi:MAG: lysophospholipid acyltransferase family protein [Desulfobacter sp.]|nr:MAG: lysophospholipid acyltransferase family protein [Desulfobacter sp.]
MIKKRFRYLLYHYLFPYAGLFLVRLLAATYRVRIVDPENEQDILNNKGQLVYASWHQRFFPGITFFSSRRPIAIMISRSRDGEMAARAVNILGWHAVRGSSSKGGKEALAQIKALTQQGYKVGHIVDGPQGPFGTVKPGLISIAQHAGLSILPTITSGQNRWVFNSWDRFMVPKPFSRVIIRFGRSIEVPEELDTASFNRLQKKVEKRLADLYRDTDDIWRSPTRINSIYG